MYRLISEYISDMIGSPDEHDKEAMGKGERNTLEGDFDRAEKVAVDGEGHIVWGPRLRVIETFRGWFGVVSAASKHHDSRTSLFASFKILTMYMPKFSRYTRHLQPLGNVAPCS